MSSVEPVPISPIIPQRKQPDNPIEQRLIFHALSLWASFQRIQSGLVATEVTAKSLILQDHHESKKVPKNFQHATDKTWR
jgi:hypothetical protein